MEPALLQVLFGARLRRHLGQTDKHYDSHWAIHIVVDGDVNHAIAGRRQHLRGHWLWTGQPGPRIAFAPSGQLPRLHWRFALAGDLLSTWRREGLWPETPIPLRDAGAMAARADRLLDLLTGDSALDTRLRANAVEGLLLEAQRQLRAVDPPPSWVLEVQARLSARWRQAPDYQALAARFHMPVHTLRRGFRQHTGLPIHDWLLRERHRRAQELLLTSDLPIADIAERCGYQDLAYFSRQFCRFAGISPTSFRRARFA